MKPNDYIWDNHREKEKKTPTHIKEFLQEVSELSIKYNLSIVVEGGNLALNSYSPDKMSWLMDCDDSSEPLTKEEEIAKSFDIMKPTGSLERDELCNKLDKERQMREVFKKKEEEERIKKIFD